MSKEKLKKKFAFIQEQFRSKLNEIRDTLEHKSSKGSNVEQIIREFITTYLPAYNRIGQGEIIDTDGNTTSQLDVIMTNEFHPNINDLSQPSLYFIEGVACAGEVKSILSSKDLDTILKNCLRYKELNLHISRTMIIHSNDSDMKRFIEKRPYFLFAFESQLTIETIAEKVTEYNTLNCPNIWQQIDAIFLLDRGSLINCGDGKGSLQLRDTQGKSIPGYTMIPINQYPNVLFDFVTWLSMVVKKFTLHENILSYYLLKGQGF
jgi:hypothetical protein